MRYPVVFVAICASLSVCACRSRERGAPGCGYLMCVNGDVQQGCDCVPRSSAAPPAVSSPPPPTAASSTTAPSSGFTHAADPTPQRTPVEAAWVREGGEPVGRDVIDGVPVFFLQPAESDRIPDAEWFTIVVTAGISPNLPSGRRFELDVTVLGKRPWTELRPLAKSLVAMGLELAKGGGTSVPEVILPRSFPPFTRMSATMIGNLVPNEPEYLPGLEPPVRILQARPLFESEAKVAAQIGQADTLLALRRAMNESGVTVWDPERRPVDLLRGTPVGDAPAATTARPSGPARP